MVVDIGQTRNSSRENPKFSAAILDFGGHLGFRHSRINICLSWEPASLKYHVILLFIGFHGWQIQWWHYFGDSVQLRRVTSISALWSPWIHVPFLLNWSDSRLGKSSIVCMVVDTGQTKSFVRETPILQPPSSVLAAILEFDICQLNLPHLAAISLEISCTYFCRFLWMTNPMVTLL